jgi:PEP-CTERM motif-containing protein
MVRKLIVRLAFAIPLFGLTPLAHRDIIVTRNGYGDLTAPDSVLITMTDLTDNPSTGFSKMGFELPDFYGYAHGDYYDGNNKINTFTEAISDQPVTWKAPGFEFSNLSLTWEATGSDPSMVVSSAGGAPQFSSASLPFPAMVSFPGQGSGSLSQQKDKKGKKGISDSPIDVAVATPEPSSLALMLAGVGLVFAMRKRYSGLQQVS